MLLLLQFVRMLLWPWDSDALLRTTNKHQFVDVLCNFLVNCRFCFCMVSWMICAIYPPLFSGIPICTWPQEAKTKHQLLRLLNGWFRQQLTLLFRIFQLRWTWSCFHRKYSSSYVVSTRLDPLLFLGIHFLGIKRQWPSLFTWTEDKE